MYEIVYLLNSMLCLHTMLYDGEEAVKSMLMQNIDKC